MYPRKMGKSKSYKKGVKGNFQIEKIGIENDTGIENYKARNYQNSTEEKFIKYGSSFFNGGFGCIDYLENKPKK